MMTKKVRIAYLKMTQSMGMGTFAGEDMNEGDVAALYNGDMRDLEPGETRGNTDADFGPHIQSLSRYGGVQGAGTQVVDGAIQGDKDLEFFVREGAMSLMNSTPSSVEHNVDLVVWPRLDTCQVRRRAVCLPHTVPRDASACEGTTYKTGAFSCAAALLHTRAGQAAQSVACYTHVNPTGVSLNARAMHCPTFIPPSLPSQPQLYQLQLLQATALGRGGC